VLVFLLLVNGERLIVLTLIQTFSGDRRSGSGLQAARFS
jgi:hypothetical protein